MASRVDRESDVDPGRPIENPSLEQIACAPITIDLPGAPAAERVRRGLRFEKIRELRRIGEAIRVGRRVHKAAFGPPFSPHDAQSSRSVAEDRLVIGHVLVNSQIDLDRMPVEHPRWKAVPERHGDARHLAALIGAMDTLRTSSQKETSSGSLTVVVAAAAAALLKTRHASVVINTATVRCIESPRTLLRMAPLVRQPSANRASCVNLPFGSAQIAVARSSAEV
jgi:hypothetical protein